MASRAAVERVPRRRGAGQRRREVARAIDAARLAVRAQQAHRERGVRPRPPGEHALDPRRDERRFVRRGEPVEQLRARGDRDPVGPGKRGRRHRAARVGQRTRAGRRGRHGRPAEAAGRTPAAARSVGDRAATASATEAARPLRGASDPAPGWEAVRTRAAPSTEILARNAVQVSSPSHWRYSLVEDPHAARCSRHARFSRPAAAWRRPPRQVPGRARHRRRRDGGGRLGARTCSSRSGSPSSSSCRRCSSTRRSSSAFCARRAPPSRSAASTAFASSTSARWRPARRTWSWSTSRGRTSRRIVEQRTGRCPSRTSSTGCSRRARRWPRRTSSASSTAISSRRTSSSRAGPTGRPRVKVLDFGISKQQPTGGADAGVTKTQAVLGLAAVHVARADALDEGRRRARRRLGARRRPPRARRGRAALRRRDDDRPLRRHPAGPAAPDPLARPDVPPQLEARPARRAREGPRPPLPERRPARCGAGPVRVDGGARVGRAHRARARRVARPSRCDPRASAPALLRRRRRWRRRPGGRGRSRRRSAPSRRRAPPSPWSACGHSSSSRWRARVGLVVWKRHPSARCRARVRAAAGGVRRGRCRCHASPGRGPERRARGAERLARASAVGCRGAVVEARPPRRARAVPGAVPGRPTRRHPAADAEAARPTAIPSETIAEDEPAPSRCARIAAASVVALVRRRAAPRSGAGRRRRIRPSPSRSTTRRRSSWPPASGATPAPSSRRASASIRRRSPSSIWPTATSASGERRARGRRFSTSRRPSTRTAAPRRPSASGSRATAPGRSSPSSRSSSSTCRRRCASQASS